MLERRADSPSYCFSEKSSKREERLERAGVSVTQALVSLSSPPPRALLLTPANFLPRRKKIVIS